MPMWTIRIDFNSYLYTDCEKEMIRFRDETMNFNSYLYTDCEAWDTFPALSDLVLPFSRTSFWRPVPEAYTARLRTP